MRLSKKTDFKAVTCQVKASFLISSKFLFYYSLDINTASYSYPSINNWPIAPYSISSFDPF
jgi:hypothetical protein